MQQVRGRLLKKRKFVTICLGSKIQQVNGTFNNISVILWQSVFLMWWSLSVTCLWFSLGTPVCSTKKTDGHDITEILLKVALNTITLTRNKQTLMQIHKVRSYINPIWHLVSTEFENYYASCIKNNQGYSLNQWAENKLRDESYVNCQFIIASNMTLYTVRKSVCESG